MSYWSDKSQRQFLLVVAGGHGSTGTKAGDAIVAYALPKQQG
jgi:quinoprotein glucose dehydrogenase